MEYLNGKTWAQITREERFFCAELYNELKMNSKPFLDEYQLSNQKYEIGFEVCFYRDLLKAYKMENFDFPLKRTFDLVLFSDKEIHIFEAKSQQGFVNEQLDNFKEDRDKIRCLFEKINEEKKLKLNIPEVKLWAIISSKYEPKEETRKYFEKIISWRDIYNLYKNELYKRADDIYND